MSLETMNGDGMDRYRRVALLLRRKAKLAGYIMVTGLEWRAAVVMMWPNRRGPSCGRVDIVTMGEDAEVVAQVLVLLIC